MKKFLRVHFRKIFLVFMLIFALTFSACTYSDKPSETDDGESYIGNVDGFKATYRPEVYPVQDYYSSYAEDILINLAKIFGLASLPTNTENEIDIVRTSYNNYLSNPANYETEPLTYDDYEDNYRVYFIDDIRNSMYEDFDNDNYMEVTDTFYSNLTLKWLWTMGIGTDYIQYENSNYAKIYGEIFAISSDAETTIENVSGSYKPERENFYLSYYVNKYTEPMQVAILEILLGRTPTTFTYNLTTGTITPSASSLLPALKDDYSKYTTYLGISKETDLPKITNYILDYVIGSQKFSATNANNHFSRNDYKQIIDQMIWNGSLENYDFADANGNSLNVGSIYDTFPTNLIKDYASNSFFISSVNGKNFAHIPSGEYQSLVMMPKEENYLSEIWYFIVADRVLDVDVYYRYYDSTTGKFYQSQPKTVKTEIESSFNEGRAQILKVNFYDAQNKETLFLTRPFNKSIGNGILEATSPKYMNSQIAQYYKTKPSVNGFGTISILNETVFMNNQSSFFEMVFDVHKDAQNPLADYSFKVGMYSLWFASQAQINNYLVGK